MALTLAIEDLRPGATATIPEEVSVRKWMDGTDGEGDTEIAQQTEFAVRDLLQLADCGLHVADGVVYVAGRVRHRSDVGALMSVLRHVPGVRAVRGCIEC